MSMERFEKCLERALDGIHRIELRITEMEKDLARNTDDMEEHIRRTNLLEKKMGKIYAIMLVGAGFALASGGPQIISWLKVLL